MIYLILVDLVIISHFLFVVFVVFGGFLLLANRRWIFLHLPCVVWGVTVELQGWICPLTPLEMWLREKAQIGLYEGDFIEHYLSLILYPPFLSANLQLSLGVIAVVINLLIYYWVFRRRTPRE